MLAKTESVAFVGTEAHLVEVEVDVMSGGLPTFRIVGLPAKSVMEAEQRTRSALVASSERWPPSRIIANLAPGGLRKEGTHFDLAIALGVLAGDKRLDAATLGGWVFLGELGLDGAVRPVRGTIAAAITCRKLGRRGLVCPAANAGEAASIDGLQVVPIRTLTEAILFLRGKWQPIAVEAVPAGELGPEEDMRDVRGHTTAKEALEIAAAGGHNVMLKGPPGSGKTMLAQRLPGVLPRMSPDECLDVTRIHSIAGVLPERSGLVSARPFRSPHHNISLAGLVGGGLGLPRPGEISLACHGVLFLDELTLFRREILESLRGPVEEGTVRIVRSEGAVTFPCHFTLVAAMNPCLCGFKDDTRRRCRCSGRDLIIHKARLSGPLIDRFDIQVSLSSLSKDELLGEPTGDTSAEIRARVEAARDMQKHRYHSTLITNGTAPKRLLDVSTTLDPAARRLIGEAIDSAELTGRGVTRVLRVARTVADLQGDELVTARHIGAALALRLDDLKEQEAA